MPWPQWSTCRQRFSVGRAKRGRPSVALLLEPTPEQLMCLAANPDLAGAANLALEVFATATTCDNISATEAIRQLLNEACHEGATAQSFVERVELATDVIDLAAYEEEYASYQTCDGRTGAQAVRDAYDEAMRDGGCRGARERMEEVLADLGWIDYSELELTCPCLAGVLDGMIGIGTNWLCTSLASFEGAESRILKVTTSPPPNSGMPSNFWSRSDEQFTVAATTFTYPNLNPVIVVNPKLCDGSLSIPHVPSQNPNHKGQLITLFIHEGMHARFVEELAQLVDLPARYPMNKSLIDLFHEVYLDPLGGGECPTLSDEPEHEAMVRRYIWQIASALWEYNNKVGTVEDYMYMAGAGLFGYDQHWSECALRFYTASQLADFVRSDQQLRISSPHLFQPVCR